MKTNLLEKLDWRYAVKKFDGETHLEEGLVQDLLKAANGAPSSFGLQPYRVVVVSDAATKAKIFADPCPQPQIPSSSHVIIFACRTDINDDLVDDYMERVASIRGVAASSLEGFGSMIKGSLKGMGDKGVALWAEKQTYISLGMLLTAAALEGVDACPMEGFNSEKMDALLGLSQKNLRSLVLCTLGKRSLSDEIQNYKKVRLALSDFAQAVKL